MELIRLLIVKLVDGEFELNNTAAEFEYHILNLVWKSIKLIIGLSNRLYLTLPVLLLSSV